MQKKETLFENRLYLAAMVISVLMVTALLYACCVGAKQLYYGIFYPTYIALSNFFDTHERQVFESVGVVGMSCVFNYFVYKAFGRVERSRAVDKRILNKQLQKLRNELAQEIRNSGKTLEVKAVAEQKIKELSEISKSLQFENNILKSEIEMLKTPEVVAERERILEKNSNEAELKDSLHHIYEVRS